MYVSEGLQDSQNGPREGSGKPKRLTLKATPVPLEFEVAVIEPRTPVVGLSGRVAVYETPSGLLFVMRAFPSLPVMPGMTGPSNDGEPSMSVAPGVCALTTARPERTAKAIAECILYCFWGFGSKRMMTLKLSEGMSN